MCCQKLVLKLYTVYLSNAVCQHILHSPRMDLAEEIEVVRAISTKMKEVTEKLDSEGRVWYAATKGAVDEKLLTKDGVLHKDIVMKECELCPPPVDFRPHWKMIKKGEMHDSLYCMVQKCREGRATSTHHKYFENTINITPTYNVGSFMSAILCKLSQGSPKCPINYPNFVIWCVETVVMRMQRWNWSISCVEYQERSEDDNHNLNILWICESATRCHAVSARLWSTYDHNNM